MKTRKFILPIAAVFAAVSLAACGGAQGTDSVTQTETAIPDSQVVPADAGEDDFIETGTDSVPGPRIRNIKADLSTPEAIRTYLSNSEHAAEFAQGIIPDVLEVSPEYARKLIQNGYEKFIIVDKNTMTVRLFDRFGRELKQYGMACGRNYGTKIGRGDCRTPEGFFALEGRYDSTNWLYTNDRGYTSPKRGQFGPRFLRLLIPTTRAIGIHGTCAPGSIGHRASHGCIRIKNENILELFELVEVGMPIIVNPGPNDVAANRKNGKDIPFIQLTPVKKDLEEVVKEAEAKKGAAEKAKAKAAEKQAQKASAAGSTPTKGAPKAEEAPAKADAPAAVETVAPAQETPAAPAAPEAPAAPAPEAPAPASAE